MGMSNSVADIAQLDSNVRSRPHCQVCDKYSHWQLALTIHLSRRGCWLFLQSHRQLCDAVSQLASEVQADEALSARIKHKFKIKNTVRWQQLLDCGV